MNKYSLLAFASVFATVGAIGIANAQTTRPTMTDEAVMPALYTKGGTVVNTTNGTTLSSGTYYLAPGGVDPIDYYGNGMYYDPSTQSYGGSSVNDPNGTAGIYLGYTSTVLSGSNPADAVPGVPNTGGGVGQSSAEWLILAVTGLAMMFGASYVIYRTAVV